MSVCACVSVCLCECVCVQCVCTLRYMYYLGCQPVLCDECACRCADSVAEAINPYWYLAVHISVNVSCRLTRCSEDTMSSAGTVVSDLKHVPDVIYPCQELVES